SETQIRDRGEAAARSATMATTSLPSEIDSDPEVRAKALNERAWALATSPDVQMRDPHTAVEVAQQAVKLAPITADYWNTLGVAQYRDAKYKDAVASLQRYRELRAGDEEWSNPFFLAMAHHRLGNKEEARQWFDKGAQWMDAKTARGAAMVRFRNEASELLGVTAKKKGDSSSPPPTA